MPLEENPYIVPHFKAFNSGQKLWGGQRCSSTLSLWNTLLKITILLHSMASDHFHLLLTVSRYEKFSKLNIHVGSNKGMYSGAGKVWSASQKYYIKTQKRAMLRKDFQLFKTQLWSWPARTKLMKIRGFQKCKIHSFSFNKGFQNYSMSKLIQIWPSWDSYSGPA